MIFYRESLHLQGLDPCNRLLARRRLHRHRPVCRHLLQPRPAKHRLLRPRCGARRCSVCPRRLHRPKMVLRARQCRRPRRVRNHTQCHHCRCRPQLQRHRLPHLLLITLTVRHRIFQRRLLLLRRCHRPPQCIRHPMWLRQHHRHHRHHHQLPRFQRHPHRHRCRRHLCRQ